MTVIDILLKNRGLTQAKEIREFFSPSAPEKIDLPSAGLDETNMTRAVQLIKQAVKDKRPICVYGDYDADGICATAVLWEALNQLKAKALPYIAARSEPVRGLSVKGLKNFKDQPLVITVDNGITSFAAAEYAQKEGIDLIITDHHQAKDKLPAAAAIVHSTRLAGVGVAWFLARHLRGERSSHLEGGGLDLAALGTIADMMPLVGVNRSLVKFGLIKLQKTGRPGIKALLDLTQVNLATISPHHVSFVLAPRLNAIGRLADSLDALRLLCSTSKERVKTLAAKLHQVNQERQDKTLAMWEHARALVKPKDKLIFLADKSYHEGLVGLVAGRLAEEFRRPAFVAAIGPQHAKASCRSIKAFNAINAIRELGDLILEHGGHPLAAGFTAAGANLPAIRKKLTAAAANLTEKDFAPESGYDCPLALAKINWGLFQKLQRFEPFGFANPVPTFLAKKVKLLSFYPVGKKNRHLKLKLPGFNAIAFGKGDLTEKLKPGQAADIIYSLEENTWNNHHSLELKIKEIRT